MEFASTRVSAENQSEGDRFLAMLPLELFERVLTHPVGMQLSRARTISRLREAWLHGEWPTQPIDWPHPDATALLREWVTHPDHQLLRLCRNSEEFTDELLLDVLQVFESWDRNLHRAKQDLLAHLREEYPEDEDVEELTDETLIAWLKELSQEELEQLIRQRLKLIVSTVEALETHFADQATAIGIGGLQAKWGERIATWNRLSDVFGPLSQQLSLGWDLAAGILQSRGWQDLLKYRELIDRIPEIRQLIDELGRLQSSDDDDTDPNYAHLFNSLRRTTEELRPLEHPLARHQAQGIERSDDFIRMIPSEALLRRRPGLKRLWHAKLAERGLLTYRVRGTYVDRVSIEGDERQPQSKKRIRGPIIVCVDTSGSMIGHPEAVAKALTLEACRIAHAEQRRCLLFSFSGSNQCEEHELSLSPDGLDSLLRFLTMSFDGGTDIVAPFRNALSRLETDEWARADILLVSDGDFSTSQVDAIRPRVDAARKELSLRVAGLCIGQGPHSPMQELCEPMIRIGSW